MIIEGQYEGALISRFWWTWGCVPPYERFVREENGYWVIATENIVFRFYLERAYEQQLHEELLDPEWPSEYWESKMDYARDVL